MLLSFNLSTAISSAVFLFLVHKRGFDFHFWLSKFEVSAALYFICSKKQHKKQNRLYQGG